MSIKRSHILLMFILFGGAALRLYGIGYGLPYTFHQDEPVIVNHALAYGTGDFNPHFFIIPPLTSYVLFFFYAVYFAALKVSGMIGTAQDFAISFFRDPAPFYLIGRFFIGFIPSMVNICLVYKLASKFASKRAAVYSSLVMALTFLNVSNAHYVYTDNLLVLSVLLAFLAMTALVEKPSRANYAICGFCIGLAIAVKYNAAALLAPFLVAHMMTGKKSLLETVLDARLAIFALSAVLTFAILNPYSILDAVFFISSVTGRIRQGYMGFFHHITYSLFEGFGSAATLLGIAGLLAKLLADRKRGLFLLSLPAIFYLHLMFNSQVYSRYVLVLIPFLSIGLGCLFYDNLYPMTGSRPARYVLVILSIAVLLPTAAKSVKADILFNRSDTRAQTAEWINANIPASTKIALDHTFFAPPIKQSAGQLNEKESILGRQPELKDLKAQKLKLQVMALGAQKTYEVYYLGKGDENAGQFLGFWPVIKSDLAELKEKGIEYVVINNMNMSADTPRFRWELQKNCRIISEFSPYKDGPFRSSYDMFETTCIPIDDKELYSRRRLGPYLAIYKIK